MVQENVERVHVVLEVWNRGDVDALVQLMSTDVEISTALAGVEGSYRGREGVRRWWRDFHEVFPDWRAEALEVRPVGDATVASLRLTGHGGGSGAPVDQTIWHVMHWRDGKAVRISRHEVEAEALAAAAVPA